MTYEEVALAREALAQKLADGTLKPFSDQYSSESGRLDQLAAACRLRAESAANERHAAQVEAAIAANSAVAENQGRLQALLETAAHLVSHGDASLVAMKDLSAAIRELSPINMVKAMVARVKTVKP